VLSIFDGRFTHQNIVDSTPIKNEKSAGWIFHYLTGGSVALIYPILYLASPVTVPEGHLIASLLFGLATSFLPWFILFPGFGWGFFGIRAPSGIRPLIATITFHTIYGLGLGIVLNITV
jgi:hypothetical protein